MPLIDVLNVFMTLADSSVDGGANNNTTVAGTSGAVSPALLKSALVTHQRSQSLSGLQVT